MKKLILLSALLFSFNGWAEVINKSSGLIDKENVDQEITKIEKMYDNSSASKVMAMAAYKDKIAWGICTNMPSIKRARDCALTMCRIKNTQCKIVAENNTAKENVFAEIGKDLGWNNQSRSTNNQPRSTNNQSQQLSTYDLCLQRLQSSRKNYQCTVPPTKQGGWGGFAVQVNACRAQAQRAYPDSICYGISQPRYEAPQQNNSVQLCNFKCWGGQIVQGDCNTPAVTVNGKSCPRM